MDPTILLKQNCEVQGKQIKPVQTEAAIHINIFSHQHVEET